MSVTVRLLQSSVFLTGKRYVSNKNSRNSSNKGISVYLCSLLGLIGELYPCQLNTRLLKITGFVRCPSRRVELNKSFHTESKFPHGWPSTIRMLVFSLVRLKKFMIRNALYQSVSVWCIFTYAYLWSEKKISVVVAVLGHVFHTSCDVTTTCVKMQDVRSILNKI